MNRTLVEDACAILRRHGINAYEQGGAAVVYAASTSRWQPVAQLNAPARVMIDAPTLAKHYAEQVMDLCSGPHSHELVV